jgi:ribosome-associated protein
MSETTPEKILPTPPIVAALVQALDDKKARDLRVLQVAEQSSITDYLILGTGEAGPHLRALRVELERVLDEAGAPIAGVDFGPESGWIVFDAYQVMIHLFLQEQREIYQLEKLWGDAVELDPASMIVPKENQGAPVN